MKEAKKCECGCGKMASPGRRFVHGHNQKNKHIARLVIRPKKKVVRKRSMSGLIGDLVQSLKAKREALDKLIKGLEDIAS